MHGGRERSSNDPELIGTLVRDLLPYKRGAGDYQDIALWRRLVRVTALEMLAECEGPLVVPMTVVVPSYFDEIVGGLRRDGVRVDHFALLADAETIRARVRGSDRQEWAEANLERCLSGLRDPRFETHIDASTASAEEIAGVIVSSLGPPGTTPSPEPRGGGRPGPRGARVVFVYGPPAAGKLTVASLLAERTGFRLSHNHAIIDAVLPLFEYGTEPFRELVNHFREELIETAVSERVDFVMTYGYVAEEEAVVARYVDLVERNGGTVLFVQLSAAPETLADRVTHPSRREHGKLTDPEPLREMLGRWDFTATVPFASNLAIDTEAHTPAQAVESIIAHYRLGAR